MIVRSVIEWEIDPVKWVAAAAEARGIYDDEISPEDPTAVVLYATGYADAEDHLPRWARDSLRVVSQTTKIVE